MRILIIGGNGRTGQLVVDEALRRGHTVTALLRNPDRLAPQTGLKIVKGSPMEKADVEAAFNATEPDLPAAVIITLNSARTSENPWAAVASPPRMMADSNANVVAAMKKHGIRKLVTMSSFGVADSWPNASWPLKALFKWSNMSAALKDHELVDREVKESDVDYVIARPLMLKDGDAQQVKEHGNDGAQGVGLTSSITRKSVAIFLVDAAEKSKWDKTTPVLTN